MSFIRSIDNSDSQIYLREVDKSRKSTTRVPFSFPLSFFFPHLYTPVDSRLFTLKFITIKAASSTQSHIFKITAAIRKDSQCFGNRVYVRRPMPLSPLISGILSDSWDGVEYRNHVPYLLHFWPLLLHELSWMCNWGLVVHYLFYVVYL
jgi:hypothetical protein